jgi:putative FmdB family regulatory protein
MPIYEYECSDHGEFEAERPMRLSAEPGECPVCQGAARRLLSTTRTRLLPRAASLARDRNEKSQHAPELRQSVEPRPKGLRKRPLQAGHGRPWMLGHG